ncbi:unnamed protein product [Linum trigynum]|uniref:3'(2'),5'-bisphosphate nucleotidase n=1 Tax=Linum trigynum TaxID=586398 RepID=A0AAV2EI27_9ROSI
MVLRLSYPLISVLSKHLTDWSVQAVVSWLLAESFQDQNVSIVAEEDIQALSKAELSDLLAPITKTVNESLAKAPKYGLRSPKKPLGASEVLEAISRCNSAGGRTGRHWVLDPVDGTLGFVRGDQYAVALALIEDGKVMMGVLGCPNYPMKNGWLNHHRHRYNESMSSTVTDTRDKGCVIYAQKGSGKAWMQPLVHKNKTFEWPNSAKQIKVSSIDDPGLATFCEPVEKANSNHSFTAGVTHSMGFN